MNDGGPAFPTADTYATHSDSPPYEQTGIQTDVTAGMSLRDYFAAKMIPVFDAQFLNTPQGQSEAARLSYLMADAMIAARGKTE